MIRSRVSGLAALSLAGLFLLYFFGLTRTGLVGPDEPRYAAIGRAMAATGDWITPRLWGQPWFEKPALLYWMTAAGFKAGLGPDLAPRLPVALVSVAFLIYFFVALRREFGDRAAWFSTAILATSAGWLVYGHVAVTDLPMSAAFAAAMLTLLTHPGGSKSSLAAGALLGVAVLAKGLVPLVLFIPALWFLRQRMRDLTLTLAAAAVIAAPWYLLVTLRNGAAFLDDFFWKQQFGRFLTSELQHGQPWWFYVPVLLLSLFPWTPLIALLISARQFRDRRTHFLLAWFVWGFVFFSASRNKLPGYLLPLLPALAALLGIATAEARARAPKLAAALALSAVLLCLVPPIDGALPQVLLAGISHTKIRLITLWIVPALFLGLACAYFELAGRRGLAVGLVTAVTALSVINMVWNVYPQLDRKVSARAVWVSKGPSIGCLPPVSRSLHYGIDYYAARSLPDCK